MNPSRWSIPGRLAGCLVLLFLLLLLVGLQAGWQANALRRELASLVDDSLPSVMLLHQLDALRQGDLLHLLEFVEARTPERRAEIGRRMAAAQAAFADTMARAETLLADAEERRWLDEFKRARADFMAAFHQMKELSLQENRPPTGELAGATGLLPKFSAAQQSLQSLMRYHENLGLAAGRSGKAHALAGVRRITWTLAGALVLTVLLAWLVVRSVRRSLGRISGSLEQGALHTASAARQVASASRTLSSGASEQASSVEETSTSLEEVSSMIQATAENAQRAKALASETRAAAELSSRRRSEVSQVMAAMDDSNSQVAKIVKNIDEIAFQTNILALNAAVEAARAGEAGAGFAVVADEVRSLAQRSAAAARETAERIELAIASSRKGAQLSQLVGDSLGEIAEKMVATDVLVGEIASAAREQAQGIEQINQAIGQMDRMTQNTASSAEETAAAAEQMNAQAACLNDQVDQLRRLVGARPGAGTAGPGHHVRPAAQGRARRPAALAAAPGRPRAIPMPGDPPSPGPRHS